MQCFLTMQDKTVAARLKETVSILVNKMVTADGAYVANSFDQYKNWQVLPGDTSINYGHNLQVAWLSAAAIDALQASGAVDSATAAKWKKVLVTIASTAAAEGYDSQYGGAWAMPPF